MPGNAATPDSLEGVSAVATVPTPMLSPFDTNFKYLNNLLFDIRVSTQ